MIDTHCHLDLEAFDADRDEVVARATAAGVRGMLVPGVRPRTWTALAEFAERHAAVGVRCAIGVHPQVVPELERVEIDDADDANTFAKTIVRHALEARAVAIGECGLDGGTPDRDRQELVFRAHVRAARITGLPLVIHVLRAHDVAPKILREEAGGAALAGVLHSYSGGAELVGPYAALGLSFSFAGPITYENARRPGDAARLIPADRLLAETDAPDQAPASHRSQRSEPAFVADVIAALAGARGVSTSEMVSLTSANAQRLFGTWRQGAR